VIVFCRNVGEFDDVDANDNDVDGDFDCNGNGEGRENTGAETGRHVGSMRMVSMMRTAFSVDCTSTRIG